MRTGIMVVDDTPESLRLLVGILSAEGYVVRPADSGSLALASAKANPPELIILDIRMPGIDGYEVCRRLKQCEKTSSVPVIFVSAASEVDDRIEGLSLGAVDYVTKPYQREELIARVRTHLELARLRSHLDKLVQERTAELKEANESLQRSAVFLRQFMRDVLLSVTDGVLVLCHEEDDLPGTLPELYATIAIKAPVDLHDFREFVDRAGALCGLTDNNTFDLINGAHEVAMNAIIHAGCGEANVYTDIAEGNVQVRITDSGPGISLEHIPHATLMKGYTTAGTFGHGLKIVLASVDHLYLLTRSTGTTAIIEQSRNRPDAAIRNIYGEIPSADPKSK